MSFELLEGVLYGKEVVAVVILFEDLFAKAVFDAALQNVGVVCWFYLSA